MLKALYRMKVISLAGTIAIRGCSLLGASSKFAASQTTIAVNNAFIPASSSSIRAS
jgi:hypothetical protein